MRTVRGIYRWNSLKCHGFQENIQLLNRNVKEITDSQTGKMREPWLLVSNSLVYTDRQDGNFLMK